MSLWLGMYHFYTHLPLWQGEWTYPDDFSLITIPILIVLSPNPCQIPFLWSPDVSSDVPVIICYQGHLIRTTVDIDFVTTVSTGASDWRSCPHHHLLLFSKVSREPFAFSQLTFALRIELSHPKTVSEDCVMVLLLYQKRVISLRIRVQWSTIQHPFVQKWVSKNMTPRSWNSLWWMSEF